MNIVSNIKSNKLASFLVFITFIIFLALILNYYNDSGSLFSQKGNSNNTVVAPLAPDNFGASSTNSSTKSSNSIERIVTKNSQVSIVVNDVGKSVDEISSYAKTTGGYMVSSDYSKKDQSSFATLTIRVPVVKFESTLSYLRSVGIKVTDENLMGTDITGEYKDIATQLNTLLTTKVKFEALLSKATEIQDILNIQQQIISVENQIDSLKGQQMKLKNDSEMSTFAVYLSTDEFALPYTPANGFDPSTIYKQAVRSMVTFLASIGTALIWLGVYAVIWLPLLIVIIFLYRKSIKQGE